MTAIETVRLELGGRITDSVAFLITARSTSNGLPYLDLYVNGLLYTSQNLENAVFSIVTRRDPRLPDLDEGMRNKILEQIHVVKSSFDRISSAISLRS